MATETAENTKKLGFSISGEFFTSFARDRMVESGWREGYKVLMESLEGMPHELALEILQGKKRLVGVNDLEVEDELPETRDAHEKRLGYQFRDVFSFNGKLWRPYGYVSGGCAEDMRVARAIVDGDDEPYSMALQGNLDWRAAKERLWGEFNHNGGIWRAYNKPDS